MKNDKVKKWLCLILIFGGFFILRNFIPSGLDQAGWDGFLVLFVAVLLWLTEAVPMAVTAVFVLFFGAWVGFEKEANILANFDRPVLSACGDGHRPDLYQGWPWPQNFTLRFADVRE